MTSPDGAGVAVRPMSGPVRFFDAAVEVFETAAARVGVREHDFLIAGARVRLRFAGDALEPRLLRAIAHLETPVTDDAPALTVGLFDSLTTGVSMVPPAWGPYDYGPKGEIVGFNDDRIRTSFIPGIDVLNVYDQVRRLGLYWVATPDLVPWWETPLRTMLHWWAAPTSLQPLHGGAVGRNGSGVLVVGNSGSGKSTTTLACLEAGLAYVADDYLVADVETPTAYSLYGTAKLEPENLPRFPSLVPFVGNSEHLDEQKAIVYLHPGRTDSLAPSLRLRAMVLPNVTGRRDTTVEPGSHAEALRVLVTTTSFHLPGYAREVMTKLNHLVRALPCYRLDAGTDLDQLAATVANLAQP